MKEKLESLLAWYQGLSPVTLHRIECFYTGDALFKDPFNEFRSRESLRQTYAHMFTKLDSPRFLISKSAIQGNQAFAVWEMRFEVNKRPMIIHGCSHFHFNEDGLVQYHRDYWDTSEELYEKIPVIGFFLKNIKKKFKTKTPR